MSHDRNWVPIWGAKDTDIPGTRYLTAFLVYPRGRYLLTDRDLILGKNHSVIYANGSPVKRALQLVSWILNRSSFHSSLLQQESWAFRCIADLITPEMRRNPQLDGFSKTYSVLVLGISVSTDPTFLTKHWYSCHARRCWMTLESDHSLL